jgi:hypothetical protein
VNLDRLMLKFGHYRDHGYSVSRHGDKGWTLQDGEGAYLMIGSHGGVAPRKFDAELEAYRRIEEDSR